MSKNSRHGTKMNKRFEMEEKRRRERMGLPTEVPRDPETQTELIGEILDVPDPTSASKPN
jgi:hypothetical protein